ncbi:MAG: aldehyde dehydrogenase family protein [Candidatus Dormibacteraeota bacterium]|uniref:Aldehyde dehydrogenase family protein n=1 Tax=Candidatus Dormiibacter inghamiae TaxID=3127013 RepID=A0A934KF92_9BACT|nr:aldehyde dehydrogenase family protein [Candidatus Dormibacteraeota bacterium]MBJ7604919.1 aldehyde dehydrogenase family protein [Candidatus Dormibacteraeota bacterium]
MSTIPAEVRNAMIGGEPVAAAATFAVVNPSTGEPLAEVARCGATEIDQAVAAARHTFETAWRKTTAVERARILRRIGALIERDSEELARLETLDTGKPLSQGRADVRVAARYFEYYADTVEALFGDTVPGPSDVLIYTLNEPFGVTGHIIPWNYPIQISSRTAAPALAAGNCCVLKPAEEAPLTSLRLAELALEAGLPPGALNVVPGLGEEAGAALAAHRGIDHLAFTGSVEVGRIVSRAAAENVIPVTLELGGKSPNLVLADADLEAAAPVIVNSIIQNAGQTCSAGSRLLVAEPIHERLVELVSERMKTISIGPGLDDPQLGPLISAAQRDRVRGFVESVGSGVHLVCGGSPPADEKLRGGYFFQPTLFDGVAPESKLGQEEVFGPVLAVTPFSDLEQAVRLANATDYGLIAAIWTTDVGRAHWLAREVRAGQVYINTYGAGGGVELPFGGFKRSGHGREKGFEALRAYTQTKTIAVKLAGG